METGKTWLTQIPLYLYPTELDDLLRREREEVADRVQAYPEVKKDKIILNFILKFKRRT